MKIVLLMLMVTCSGGLCLSSCGFTNNKTSSGSSGGGPVPAPGASGGPGVASATFTQVNQQILQPSCVSCHSGGQAPDLSSYSGFATDTTFVVPGNSGSSLLYTICASGQMPLGGSALSSTQLTLLASWIDSGALND